MLRQYRSSHENGIGPCLGRRAILSCGCTSMTPRSSLSQGAERGAHEIVGCEPLVWLTAASGWRWRTRSKAER